MTQDPQPPRHGRQGPQGQPQQDQPPQYGPQPPPNYLPPGSYPPPPPPPKKRGKGWVWALVGAAVALILVGVAQGGGSRATARSSAPVGAASTPLPALETSTSTTTDAAAPRAFTLRVEGTAKRATVYYGADGSSGGGAQVTVPWTMTLPDTQQFGYATVSASTPMGSAGTVTCTITDESGQVLDQKSATSQGGSFGSADVNCGANRTG